jgi:cold shock CspA family protein
MTGEDSTMNGVVLWYSPRLKYGFIQKVNTDTNFFCHADNLKCDGYKRLHPGEYVSFKSRKSSEDKTEAYDVTGAFGGKLLCENEKYHFKVNRKRNSTNNEVLENQE